MAIPAIFGLTTPSTTLGEYDNSNIGAAPSNQIISTTAGAIGAVLWTAPSTTLTNPISSTISNAPSNDIKSSTAGTIQTVLWSVPSTTLANPIVSVAINTVANDIKTISAGTTKNYGAFVPSVGMGALFSTHIYTSDKLITSIGGTAATPTQTWYMS